MNITRRHVFRVVQNTAQAGFRIIKAAKGQGEAGAAFGGIINYYRRPVVFNRTQPGPVLAGPGHGVAASVYDPQV